MCGADNEYSVEVFCLRKKMFEGICSKNQSVQNKHSIVNVIRGKKTVHRKMELAVPYFFNKKGEAIAASPK